MITGIIGKKIDQTQKFLEDGSRIPVTIISVGMLPITGVKTKAKHGYVSVQLGFGLRKKATKAQLGHAKGAKLDKAPRFLKEIRLDKKQDVLDEELPVVGSTVKASDVLKPGDIVDVTGTSKGKGYAGVVKRHGFRGGPRTHGQSDRERAPGSIGQTTTPGRVYKGKKMAGHMGTDTKTIQRLKVVEVLENEVLIKGLVPGHRNSMVTIIKVGEDKKFVPLLKPEVSQEEPQETTQEPQKAEEQSQEVQQPPVEASSVIANEVQQSQTEETASEPEAPRSDEEKVEEQTKEDSK